MYKIVYTHFEPQDMLNEYNTIILKEKKKVFKTLKEAVHHITVEEKRNITKKYRRMFPEGEGDPVYLDYVVHNFEKNRYTIDVFGWFSDNLYERYEYLIIKI